MVDEVLVEGLGEGLVSYVFGHELLPGSLIKVKRGEPSCVGPIPPLVITRSYFLMSLLLASMLKTCDGQFSAHDIRHEQVTHISSSLSAMTSTLFLEIQPLDSSKTITTARLRELRTYSSTPCTKQYCANVCELRSWVLPLRISSLWKQRRISRGSDVNVSEKCTR